jgi:hypothetical protein
VNLCNKPQPWDLFVDVLPRANTLLDMGYSGPTININADALEYGEQKFLKLYGKDYASLELTQWFKGIQDAALIQTAYGALCAYARPDNPGTMTGWATFSPDDINTPASIDIGLI